MDVQQMWQACSHQKLSAVARENGLTPQALVALFDQSGLTGRTEADPGPEEIAVAARVIRAGWTPQVEKARWVAAHSSHGWV